MTLVQKSSFPKINHSTFKHLYLYGKYNVQTLQSKPILAGDETPTQRKKTSHHQLIRKFLQVSG